MYIMVMADEPSKRLYDYFDPEQFKDVDLIISCGDLSPEYLTFFATMCHAQVLYVKGTHDGKYAYCTPEGCIWGDVWIIFPVLKTSLQNGLCPYVS